MRTAMKFEIVGGTLAAIKDLAAHRIAEFLQLDDVSGVDEVADVELSVTQEDSIYPMYQATVSVRIR